MTTIDALVEALEKISTGDAWHEDGVIGFAKEALARARAEQAALTVPASAFDRLQALCDSQAERIMVMLGAEERRAGQAEHPTIYIAFASSYVSIRYWTQDAESAKRFSEREGVPITAFYAAPAVEQAEPYAYVYEFDHAMFGVHRSFSPSQWNGLKPSRTVPLYATPPAAPAKLEPLTDAEIRQCFDYAMAGNVEEHDQVTLTRVIESELNAKLGGK